jgi:[amino group carrier protein]-L-2-aminoadipate 6-kinase
VTRSLTVVKCGGATGVDARAVCAEIGAAAATGRDFILVHGGSAEASRLAARLGVTLRELVAPDGATSRYTDPEALDVLTLAWAGRVKPALLTEFARLGVPCIGITGLDAGLLRARRAASQRTLLDGRVMVVRDDHGGRLTAVRADVLRTLLAAGLIPVLSPPAITEDGTVVNVNADRIAAAVAVALDAERLVLLTAAAGVLAERDDPNSVLDSYQIPPNGGRDAMVDGGMTVKLAAAQAALAGGVGHVVVADGRHQNTIRNALAGRGGTEIQLSAPAGEESSS